MEELRRPAGHAWLLPPFALGALLRLWNLPAQVLGGDELHAVRVALVRPLRQVLTTYDLRDPCIPFTALYRLVLEHGVGPTETIVRAPTVLCGLLLLLVAPLVAARRLGRPAAVPFAWLLALSPTLVLYSRISRPYGAVALCTFGAAAAFATWWRTGRARWGAVYVLLAALAGWLHLLSLPFVLAPLLWAAGALALRRRGPGLGTLLALGAATAAAVAAFLVPARASLLALVAGKRAELDLPAATLLDVLHLQAGSRHAVAVSAFWALAAAGAWTLGRRDPPLAALAGTMAAAQVATLLVLSPEMLGHPLVFGRYLLLVLPWVLLCVALGLEGLARAAAPRLPAGLRRAVPAAFLVALFLAGPLADRAYHRSSFTGANDFVAFFCPRARLPAAGAPAFYRTLRTQTAAPVLEYPWVPLWSHTQSFYLYQEVHGQEVLVAMAQPFRGHRRLRLRNMPAPGVRGFLASRARYLVVHLDLPAEEERIVPHCRPLIPRMKAGHRSLLRGAGGGMAKRLTARWGPPDHAGGGIAVWDLARVRQHLAAEPEGDAVAGDAVAFGVPVAFPGRGVGETVEIDAGAGGVALEVGGQRQERDALAAGEGGEAALGGEEVAHPEPGGEGAALAGVGIDLDRRRQGDHREAGAARPRLAVHLPDERLGRPPGLPPLGVRRRRVDRVVEPQLLERGLAARRPARLPGADPAVERRLRLLAELEDARGVEEAVEKAPRRAAAEAVAAAVTEGGVERQAGRIARQREVGAERILLERPVVVADVVAGVEAEEDQVGAVLPDLVAQGQQLLRRAIPRDAEVEHLDPPPAQRLAAFEPALDQLPEGAVARHLEGLDHRVAEEGDAQLARRLGQGVLLVAQAVAVDAHRRVPLLAPAAGSAGAQLPAAHRVGAVEVGVGPADQPEAELQDDEREKGRRGGEGEARQQPPRSHRAAIRTACR